LRKKPDDPLDRLAHAGIVVSAGSQSVVSPADLRLVLASRRLGGVLSSTLRGLKLSRDPQNARCSRVRA
jgi:hypothetical protein